MRDELSRTGSCSIVPQKDSSTTNSSDGQRSPGLTTLEMRERLPKSDVIKGVTLPRSGLVQLRLCEASHKRKNWLFSDTVKGAQSSANLYSLIETAKANALEPYAYLRRVFTFLSAATSVADIEALLPWAASTND